MPFTDPLNFFILAFCVPILASILLLVQLVMMTIEGFQSVKKVMNYISGRYGGGYSMVSW